MNLYQLNEEFAKLEANLWADLKTAIDAGEISLEQAEQVYLDTLEAESGGLEQKLINYGKVIANKRAEAVAIAERIACMQERHKSITRSADRLETHAVNVMLQHDIEPKDAEIALTLRRSQAVIISDATWLASEYWREIPAKMEPDKVLIKNSIKEGKDVKGAYIETRHKLIIK